ncbi:porin [Azospirillum largimobile]
MNRFLLAGCAAVTLATGAGAANAQAKFDVKVSGDAYFEAGYVSQDLDANTRSSEFRNRLRVNIIPTAKADNGLEYGARIRMRANSGADNVRSMDADRAFIFVQGSFGTLRVGVSNSFSDETYISAPSDYVSAFVEQPAFWVGPNNNINGTTAGSLAFGAVQTSRNTILYPALAVESNSTKIVYFSPRLAGLQLGASYTPRNDSSNTDVSRSQYTASSAANIMGTGIFEDIWEVGANYNNSFGGVSVKASTGYMGGSAVAGAPGIAYNDLTGWQAGVIIGYAGFSVGGSYTDFNRSGERQSFAAAGAPVTEAQRNWTAGIQYASGLLTVGANYKFGADAGRTDTPGSRHVNVYEVGVSYTVAPGLTLQAQYDYVDTKGEVSTLNDKANVVLARSVLAF